MRLRTLIYPVLFFLVGCHSKDKTNEDAFSFSAPESGVSISLGTDITFKLTPAKGSKVDSVVYYIDGKRILSSKKIEKEHISSQGLSLGNRSLTAVIFKNGLSQELSNYFVLVSALIPANYSYDKTNTFPHDTTCYTEGLEYRNGYLYESGGLTNKSSLRKVDIQTGKPIKIIHIDSVFAEGIVIVENRILQLTYTENLGIEYELNSLKIINKFQMQNNRQGWGLCTDGNVIYNSDGTNKIYILNRQNYIQKGFIDVYDNEGPVKNINELEFVNGKIYANVYLTNTIVIIDPKSGQVVGKIDLGSLYPLEKRISDNKYSDVLNGIAWDNKGKRLFVTGKNWAKLFQITIKLPM